MLLPPLAERTRYFKETPEGVEYMCKAMEKRITDEKIRIAVRMLTSGLLTAEQIAAFTDLSIETIKKIENDMKTVSA